MTERVSLSARDIEAIAYFAVGVSTEGSLNGKDVSNRLSFAGTWLPDGRMKPIERSGESIGTLQKDLGQDQGVTATAMMEAYRHWAEEGRDRVVFDETEYAQLIRDFSRDGKAITKEGYRAIDPTKRAQINRFLASEAGHDFVHHRDVVQVGDLNKQGLRRLVATSAYRSASIGEQVSMVTAIAKALNQNPSAANRLLKAMKRPIESPDAIASHDDVIAYLDRTFEGALEAGQTHARTAAKLFTRLHNTPEGSPLHTAWQEVLRDPLIAPSLIGKDPERPDLTVHYTLVKNLFLEPRKAMAFIDALEQGRAHSEGRINGTGFYTDGTQVVQWNADGKGVTFVDGQWATISRDELGLTRARDGSVDLARVIEGEGRLLLHVEPAVRVASEAVGRALRPGAQGEDVRQLQEQLMRLGYTDAQGRPLHADGEYGPGTQAAVRAFQRDHDLVADGLSGRQTLASVRQAADGRDALVASAHRPHDEVLAAYRVIEPATVGRSPPVEARMDARTPPETIAAYESLEPVTRSAAPLLAPAEAPVAREPVAVPPGSEAPTADATRLLQERLNTLGIGDADGRPLATHGAYDMATRSAVARFQSDHGFAVTGQADASTHEAVKNEAFIATLRDRSPTMAAEPARPAPDTSLAPTWAPAAPMTIAPEPAMAVLPRLDPRHADHPQNGLYEALKTQLPEASDQRLLQSTAACHRSGITADNLSLVHINEATMTLHFFGTGPLTSPASVDLNRPSPSPEESVERMAQFDQQQTQMLAEFRAQSAQMAQGRSR